MANIKNYYTPLDIDLQNLAVSDWSAFAQLIGEEAIVKAKACMLLSRGNSYVQVANKLRIKKHQVEYMCNNKCQKKSDNNI